MTPVLIRANNDIKQNDGRLAIQRGPLVYCVEGADNENKAWNLILPENAVFETVEHKVLNEKVIALRGSVSLVSVSADGMALQTETKKILAIPYYAWANRRKNEMQIWLPTKAKNVKNQLLIISTGIKIIRDEKIYFRTVIYIIAYYEFMF